MDTARKYSIRTTVALIMLIVTSLILVGVVQAFGGQVLWTSLTQIPNNSSDGEAVAVDGGRVYVAGFAATGNGDLLLSAYDARNGQLLWQDQYDRANEADNALDVAAANGRVYVAGLAADATGEADFLVRAYDGKSGTLLWQDLYDYAGDWDVATSVVVHGGQVFAAGQAMGTGFNSNFVVRAYDAKRGTLLWQDLLDKFGAFDIANDVTAEGARVFAAGYVTNTAGNYDFYVRAYDAKRGTVLWEDQDDRGGSGGDRLHAIAVTKGRVVTAGDTSGVSGNTDLIVRTLDARKGTVIWETTYDLAGHYDSAVAIATGSSEVFAAGQARVSSGVSDFFVQAYDLKTGAILWQDQVDVGGSVDDARAVTSDGSLVIAVGGGWNTSGSTDHTELLVRAYDAKRGTLLWHDQYDSGGGNSYASGVAAAGGTAYVTGFAQLGGSGAPGTQSDQIVRSYDAK